MRTTLAVNPRRRRRHAPRRRRRSVSHFHASRAPRRRRNPTLRIASNPATAKGIMSLLTPALMVALGSLAGSMLPRTLKVIKPGAKPTTLALAAIGTGVGLAFVGQKVVGRKNAELLALGAVSAGISSFLNQVLPASMKLAGVGDVVTEADIDEEIRKLAAGGMSGVGDNTQNAFNSFAGVGADDYAVDVSPNEDYSLGAADDFAMVSIA